MSCAPTSACRRWMLKLRRTGGSMISAEEFIKSQENEVRRYETPHGVFEIRDRWELDADRPSGFRLVTCEYAVKDDAGNKVWKPCREGVSFSEIEPFERAA